MASSSPFGIAWGVPNDDPAIIKTGASSISFIGRDPTRFVDRREAQAQIVFHRGMVSHKQWFDMTVFLLAFGSDVAQYGAIDVVNKVGATSCWLLALCHE